VGIELTGIHRYPVKSCRGHALEHADVERWGLAGDRRWMVVDGGGDAVTARERPRLVLVVPEITGGGLLLRGPGMPPLAVACPSGGDAVITTVFGAEVPATPADPAAHEWFSAVAGDRVRLVHLGDPTVRPSKPAFSRPGDRVSFADGFPLLLASTESLAALNELIGAGPHAGEGPLPMTRFRPNLVVSGAPAWAEDGWRRVRIGVAEFRVAKACDRCVLTKVHPDTAVKGREPLVTLARHRRWGGKLWFAVNLIPDVPDVRIQVGDTLDVLEDAPTEPPLGAAVAADR
jgi:hypothetical protein